jgi:hypothetical protein
VRCRNAAAIARKVLLFLCEPKFFRTPPPFVTSIALEPAPGRSGKRDSRSPAYPGQLLSLYPEPHDCRSSLKRRNYAPCLTRIALTILPHALPQAEGWCHNTAGHGHG